jgi:hypothetical protein
MNRYLAVAWLMTLAAAQLHAQAKPEWKLAYEMMERNAVKSISVSNQLLLGELEEQQRMATRSGDDVRYAELEAKRVQAQRRQDVMATGRLWRPGPQEAAVEAFCHEAAGRKWSLEGTRQVGHFKLLARDIVCIGRTGTESRQRKGDPLLPGVFITGRMDGGATAYLVSPDLQNALCVVTSRVYDGHAPQWFVAMRKATPVVPVTQDADLLSILIQDVHQKHYDNEKKLLAHLETQLNEAMKRKQNEDIRGMLQPLASHRQALAYFEAPATSLPATKEAFSQKASGTMWIMRGFIQNTRFLYDGKNLITLDSANKQLDSQPAEVLWPGLIRTPAVNGLTTYLAVSPDLMHAQYFAARSQFPGKLVE